MILFAYDGSQSFRHAIRGAGTLLCARRAHVVHVWEVPTSPLEALSVVAGELDAAIDDEVARREREAGAVAEAGAALARAAGFVADAEAIRLDDPATALEDLVDRLRPELIVVGHRGQTGVKALLAGSVSRHLGA